MRISSRDANVIRHMIDYCRQIEETNKEFGDHYETFKASNTYRGDV